MRRVVVVLAACALLGAPYGAGATEAATAGEGAQEVSAGDASPPPPPTDATGDTPPPPPRKKKKKKKRTKPPADAPPVDAPPPADASPSAPAHANVHVTRAGNNMWVFPLGILIVSAAMHIYDPSTFQAGGLIASILVLFVPAGWVQAVPHPETPREKFMNRLHDWLYDGTRGNARGGGTTPNTSFSSRAESGSRGRQAVSGNSSSRAPDWWSGGGVVGSRADVQWTSADMNVELKRGKDARKAARAASREQSPYASGRSLADAGDCESPASLGAGMASPSRSVSDNSPRSDVDLSVALDQVRETEELVRLRLERTEGEDRWGLSQHMSIEHGKRLALVYRRELYTLNDDEMTARRALEAEEAAILDGVHELEARCHEDSLRLEAQGEFVRNAFTERNGVVADEAEAFARFCAAFYEEAAAAQTRPGRVRIGKEEYEGRLEVEDDEAGLRVYMRQAMGTARVEAQDAEGRRVLECEAFAAAAAVAVCGLDGCEALVRGAIARECADAFAAFAPWVARDEVDVRERMARRDVERAERRERNTTDAGHQAALMGVVLSEGVRGLVRHEADHRRGIHNREERTRAALDEDERRGALCLESAAALADACVDLRRGVAATLDRECLAARDAVAAAEDAAVAAILAEAADARADAVRREGDRLAALRADVDALCAGEAMGRDGVAAEEGACRGELEGAEGEARGGAAAAQAAREEREAGECEAVAAEEAEHRGIYTEAEAEARGALGEAFREELSAAELHDIVASIVGAEGAMRRALADEEADARGELVPVEHAARMAVADALIRGAPKAASAATARKIVRMCVVAEQAQVRERYNIRSAKVGAFNRGDIVHIVEQKGSRGRCHEIDGWVSIRGQVGNVILQPVDDHPEELTFDDLPPRAEPAPRPEPSPVEKSAAQALGQIESSFMPQVSMFGSSVSKGWKSFAGALGEVRLPAAGAMAKPRQNKPAEAPASAPAKAPIPATPDVADVAVSAETHPPVHVTHSAVPDVTPPQVSSDGGDGDDAHADMPTPAAPPVLQTPVMPRMAKKGKAD